MPNSLDALAEALAEAQPPKVESLVAVVVSRSPLTISFNGSDPIEARHSWGFDLAANALVNVVGLSVLVSLPEGQPIVTDVIVQEG